MLTSRRLPVWGRNRDPIIIGRCYRSGTSLIRRLLDAHSGIHCGPEVKCLRNFCGDYRQDDLAHIRFFTTLRSLGLGDEALLEIFGRAFVRAHELAARKRGKRRWADKNPENVLYLNEWSRLLGDRYHFVHVVRHPLDTLASLVEARFDKTVPWDFEGKVEVYRRFVEEGMGFAERHSRRMGATLPIWPSSTTSAVPMANEISSGSSLVEKPA